MGFLDFHSKFVKGISSKYIGYALLGKFIFILALGSLFSIELVKYGLYVLMISLIILVDVGRRLYVQWFENKKPSYTLVFMSITGAFLLALFVGIQSPQLHFKKTLIILGIALILPALFSLVKKK